MTRVQGFNNHRWIIFHVAFILQSKASGAQSLSPSPTELQSTQVSSRTTVFAVLITVFFLIGLLSVYIRHCARFNPDHSSRYHRRRAYDGCSRRGGLDDAVVESFPVFAYSSVKDSKIGSGGSECAICLNELEDRETVRLLPVCKHLFHIDCIGAWLYSHATCPVCRSDLTKKSIKIGDEDGTETQTPAIDHVVIDIDGYLTIDSEAAKSHHRRPSSEIAGKFPRSNSTGHSIGRLRDGTERYTLRLPDDARRRIMAAKGRRLKRTRSFDTDFTAEGRRKYWSGDEDEAGSGEKSGRIIWADRWGLLVPKSTK